MHTSKLWLVACSAFLFAACGDDDGTADAGNDAFVADAGDDGGGDAGPADAGDDAMLADAGDDAIAVDAGDDGGVDDAAIDVGPLPPGIDGLLIVPDGTVDIEIEDVLVTYLRPALGGDEDGFLAQAAPLGPAIFVEGTYEVAAGDQVSFRVTEVTTRIGHKRVTAIEDLTIISSGNDLAS